MAEACHHCYRRLAAQGGAHVCAGCHFAAYCSPACQRADWLPAAHGGRCNALAKTFYGSAIAARRRLNTYEKRRRQPDDGDVAGPVEDDSTSPGVPAAKRPRIGGGGGGGGTTAQRRRDRRLVARQQETARHAETFAEEQHTHLLRLLERLGMQWTEEMARAHHEHATADWLSRAFPRDSSGRLAYQRASAAADRQVRALLWAQRRRQATGDRDPGPEMRRLGRLVGAVPSTTAEQQSDARAAVISLMHTEAAHVLDISRRMPGARQAGKGKGPAAYATPAPDTAGPSAASDVAQLSDEQARAQSMTVAAVLREHRATEAGEAATTADRAEIAEKSSVEQEAIATAPTGHLAWQTAQNAFTAFVAGLGFVSLWYYSERATHLALVQNATAHRAAGEGLHGALAVLATPLDIAGTLPAADALPGVAAAQAPLPINSPTWAAAFRRAREAQARAGARVDLETSALAAIQQQANAAVGATQTLAAHSKYIDVLKTFGREIARWIGDAVGDAVGESVTQQFADIIAKGDSPMAIAAQVQLQADDLREQLRAETAATATTTTWGDFGVPLAVAAVSTATFVYQGYTSVSWAQWVYALLPLAEVSAAAAFAWYGELVHATLEDLLSRSGLADYLLAVPGADEEGAGDEDWPDRESEGTVQAVETIRWMLSRALPVARTGFSATMRLTAVTGGAYTGAVASLISNLTFVKDVFGETATAGAALAGVTAAGLLATGSWNPLIIVGRGFARTVSRGYLGSLATLSTSLPVLVQLVLSAVFAWAVSVLGLSQTAIFNLMVGQGETPLALTLVRQAAGLGATIVL